MAIRIYEPKVVTHFLSPRTSGGSVFMNNRYKLWFHSYMYMFLVHDNRYGLPHRACVVECAVEIQSRSKDHK